MALQGGGQQALGTNWGDGFASNPALLQGLGLSDPRPFFDTLERKPYASQASMMAAPARSAYSTERATPSGVKS